MEKVIKLNDEYNTQYEISFVKTGDWTTSFNFWVTKRSNQFNGSVHSALVFMNKKLAEYHFKSVNKINADQLYRAINLIKGKKYNCKYTKANLI